ncbi:MAG: hypothetical protein Q8L37_05935 [Candidatus Gottesmanbacteria bacterium]|nr:hypothetical protein [Candidatus Gottesmanbacteria bacterium]
MNLWIQISILIVSGMVLTGAAHLVVKQSTRLAHMVGLSNFTVGFLLLGIFTSMPELFVAMQSVHDGIPQLSAGNLLGGSILLLSFVMGTTAVLLGQVRLDHRLSGKELVVMMGVIAAPVAVLWDERLTRPEGLFLVSVYILHAFVLNQDDRKMHRKNNVVSAKGLSSHLALLAVGVGMMFLSSRFIVSGAENIMKTFAIAPVVFGLFFLSLGTNLPELALAFEGIRKRSKEIAFGDFLGSSAANTLILGLLGLVMPFSGSGNGKILGALLWLTCISAYFLWAVSSGRTVSRKEGIGLLIFYFIFVIYELAV